MDYQVREWKQILIPYEQAVEELKVKFKAIRKEYRDMNDYSPIEFITGRVKRISSILEKCKRYNIPEDNIEEMEDIAGIRIMCQFIDDIYKVVDLIRARSGKDLTIVYEKDYIGNPKESGYKSYHIIIRYPVQTAFGTKEVLAELQIRTLAMNFWATIEHSLNYKYQDRIPVDIQRRLKKTADAASLLDLEMSDIRNEIIRAQLMFEQKSNLVSDIMENLEVLISVGRKAEAFEFQERFDLMWADGSEKELEELLHEIKLTLPRYRMFEHSSHENAEETVND
jgi:putative GTP pyrophosphokinase